MTHDPQDTIIVLRLPKARKGRYVAASRAAGLTLAAWILQELDVSSDPIPPPPDSSASQGQKPCRDPDAR